MKVDLEHIHYWMCAIRESENPVRTLDAFWKGQLLSKTWLIDHLTEHVHVASNIDIYGGWVGTLASMLFQSNIPVINIRSIDIDPTCEETARTMNKKEEIEGRFNAITSDMCRTPSTANVVINTSCEHITQHQYIEWLQGLDKNSLILLQSNNYKIQEHIRTADNLEHFKEQSNVNILWAGELSLPLYTRFMIIGKLQNE